MSTVQLDTQALVWALGGFLAVALTFAGMAWRTWIGPALKAQRELTAWRTEIAGDVKALVASATARSERWKELFGRLEAIERRIARLDVHVERNRERIREIDAKAERNREQIRVLNGGRKA